LRRGGREKVTYASDCEYISLNQHRQLAQESTEIGKMLGSMLKNPASFLLTSDG
jgi:hypothetical protein